MAERKFTVAPFRECDSRAFGMMPRASRLVFMCLRNLADCHGVVTGDPWILQGVGGLRDFGEEEIAECIAHAERGGLLSTFEKDSKPFILFPDTAALWVAVDTERGPRG